MNEWIIANKELILSIMVVCITMVFIDFVKMAIKCHTGKRKW